MAVPVDKSWNRKKEINLHTNLHCKMPIFRRPYNKTSWNLKVVIPHGDRAHGDVHLSWVSHLPLPA